VSSFLNTSLPVFVSGTAQNHSSAGLGNLLVTFEQGEHQHFTDIFHGDVDDKKLGRAFGMSEAGPCSKGEPHAGNNKGINAKLLYANGIHYHLIDQIEGSEIKPRNVTPELILKHLTPPCI